MCNLFIAHNFQNTNILFNTLILAFALEFSVWLFRSWFVDMNIHFLILCRLSELSLVPLVSCSPSPHPRVVFVLASWETWATFLHMCLSFLGHRTCVLKASWSCPSLTVQVYSYFFLVDSSGPGKLDSHHLHKDLFNLFISIGVRMQNQMNLRKDWKNLWRACI